MSTFVQLQEVSKIYETGGKPFKALHQITWNINHGEIGVILGPSGSGKSTLLNVIGGIDHVDHGSILVDGIEIRNDKADSLTEYRRDSVGFIFQFYNLIPHLTVYENVEVVSNISHNPLDVNEILTAVGMKEMRDRFPRELSGGQQQRVAIARALVKKPKLLLCDEPTGALDYETSKDILHLIQEMNQTLKTTVLIITHNDAIAHLAHRIIRLRSGEIVEERVNHEIVSAERIEW